LESTHQSLPRAGAEACGDAVSTFQTKDQFFAVIVSGAGGVEGEAKLMAEKAASLFKQGASLSTVKEHLLAGLPEGEHIPFSILHAQPSTDDPQLSARLVECNAPPLFLTRGGQLVMLPVVEEEARGRLVRECEFVLQDGDHVAMVSEGYIQAKGWSRQWGWRDIATSIKRLTDTRCDAGQLLGALVRSYQRLAEGEAPRDVSVVAMFARPLRSVTVWSGPPVERAVEEVMLNKLMAETGARIICGDTTAEIAARLIGARLEMEPRPQDGWAEVPPTSRLAGMDLVTEGVVTIGKARQWISDPTFKMADFRLLRQENGATRLAKMLLAADQVHFLVGLAINPAQTADKAGTVPLRKIVMEDLMRDLQARGKVISVEYF
jgi:hypothetical protein